MRTGVLGVMVLLVLNGIAVGVAAEPEQKVIGGMNANPIRGVHPGTTVPGTPPKQTYLNMPTPRPATGGNGGGNGSGQRPTIGLPLGVPQSDNAADGRAWPTYWQQPLIVPAIDGTRVSVGSDGFYFNGTYRSGNFRGAVHIGAGNGYCWGGGWCPPDYVYYVPGREWGTTLPRPYLRSPWYGRYWNDGCWYDRHTVLIVGTMTVMDPMLAPGATQQNQGQTQPPAGQTPQIVNAPASQTPAGQSPAPAKTPPTNAELGWKALLECRFDDAALAWRDHLNEKGDEVVGMRAMGYALVGQHKVAQGVAMIVMAYETDPTLAYRSMSADLGKSRDAEETMRRVRVALVAHANKTGTSSAWLAAASALQAEGKIDAARRLLKRAEENGLEARLADEMRKALM